MNKTGQVSCLLLTLCGLSSCSSGAHDASTPKQPTASGAPAAPPGASMNTAGMGAAPTSMPGTAEPNPAADVNAEPGLHREDGALVFRTEPFTIAAGDERYICWTATTEEALKVKVIEFGGAAVVHHLTFAQTIVPEPEGFSECETLLKTTWLPLFSAGAGANKLSLPAGVAHELSAGTQLLVQVHLVNTRSEDVSEAVALTMEVTDEPDTLPVQIGGMGSFQISLPPNQKSKVTSECNLPSTSRMVALMPHMHRIATSMTLELGTSANDLKQIYARDPWNFDQQTIDNVDMTIEQGKFARVTCNYNNTTDQTIAYGESSSDEMCFLGVFWVGDPINCVVF